MVRIWLECVPKSAGAGSLVLSVEPLRVMGWVEGGYTRRGTFLGRDKLIYESFSQDPGLFLSLGCWKKSESLI